MQKSLHFHIITPERVVYESEIESVTLNTQAGEITVLPDHRPLISALAPGELTIRKDGQSLPFAVAHGVVEVRNNNQVVVLSDNSELAENIDEERAQAAYDRAKEFLAERREVSDVDYARFQAMLEKNLNRINVVRRYRKK
jgi:F-type H+-transporting ATPase subunit epsilon